MIPYLCGLSFLRQPMYLKYNSLLTTSSFSVTLNYLYIIFYLYIMFDNVINTYQDILSQVKQHIPQTVLAGGCLRDTFYGVEVKDLDFVVKLEQGQENLYPVGPYSPWLTEVWPDKTFQWCDAQFLAEYDNGGYNFVDVFESTDGTVKFIIVVDIPTYTNQFPDSISEMVFDGTTVHTSSRWRTGNTLRTIYYDEPKMKQPRLDKLHNKYPTWEFVIE